MKANYEVDKSRDRIDYRPAMKNYQGHRITDYWAVADITRRHVIARHRADEPIATD